MIKKQQIDFITHTHTHTSLFFDLFWLHDIETIWLESINNQSINQYWNSYHIIIIIIVHMNKSWTCVYVSGFFSQNQKTLNINEFYLKMRNNNNDEKLSFSSQKKKQFIFIINVSTSTAKKKIQQNRQNQFNLIQFKFMRSSSEFLLFFLIWKKNKHKQTTYRRRRRSLTGNIDAHIHSLTVIHSMNITSS